MNFSAVVFDMDGLVLDSESGYFIAWEQAATEMGYRLSADFCKSLSGQPGRVISQRLFESLGSGFDIEGFYRLSGRIWHDLVRRQGIPVKSGFYELLDCIRERALPYALATNSRRSDAEQCLNWAGLADVFPTMICRDHVSNPKPAPDIFVKSAESLGAERPDCLVLEDSPVGIAAAVAAGCPCIYVPSLLPADPRAASQADRVMQNLAEVADFISVSFHHPL
ncbi:HAD family hydrolase [Methylomonas sp. MgM2]